MRLGGAEWDEEAFQARVTARLAELGLTRNSALKGIDPRSVDLLRRKEGRGRRIDSLMKIAAALDWTLAEALGIQADPAVDPFILEMAIAVAQEQIPRRLLGRANPEAVARTAALAYDFLAQRAQRGEPVRDLADAIDQARALVRYEQNRRRSSASPGNDDQRD